MVEKKSEFQKYLGKHVRIIKHRGLKGQRSRTVEGYVTIVKGSQLFIADMDVGPHNHTIHRGHGVWITMPWHTKDTIEVIEGVDTK